MKRHFVRVAVGAVLALTALSRSVSFVAADPPPTPAPGTLVIVAGTGPKGRSGDGGHATQAQLNAPFGVAFDAAGNLFIADSAWWDNHIGRGHEPANEHVLEVVGVAAPGLIAGKPFP